MGDETSKEAALGYLAKPSGECCVKRTVHEGEARGSWEFIAEVENYIAKPPEDETNGNIILYFPDVWGMFPNGFLVMNAFADAGYLVLGLDYLRAVCWLTSVIALWIYLGSSKVTSHGKCTGSSSSPPLIAAFTNKVCFPTSRGNSSSWQ